MGSPESNTALGLQLFAPFAQQSQQQLAQRIAQNRLKVELLQRLAELQNEERVKREEQARSQAGSAALETQRQAGSVALENLRSTHQMAESDAATNRQLAVTKQAQDAQDRRDLDRQFSLSYPVYAQAAAALSQKAKAVTEYARDWDGLAQLQGDMSALKEEAAKKEKGDAAKGLITILDQSTKDLQAAIEARDQVNKISSQDEQQARAMGLTALRQAADNGVLPISSKDKKFQTALAALDKPIPDFTVAQQVLGQTGMSVYASGVQSGLLALANDKERLARINNASRDLQTAQRGASDTLVRLMQIAATNPELGPMLQDRSTALNKVEAGAAASGPDAQTVFRRLIGPPPAPAAPAGQPGGAPAAPQPFGGVPNSPWMPPAAQAYQPAAVAPWRTQPVVPAENNRLLQILQGTPLVPAGSPSLIVPDVPDAADANNFLDDGAP